MGSCFRDSFEEFMHSLATRDRDSFQKFLDEATFVFAILPPSRTFESLQSYQMSQEHWFGGSTGSFVYEIAKTEEGDNLALGIVRATYSNVDDNMNTFTLELWISFVFKKHEECWKMSFVQNTRIE